ncbi:class I SAM-dependent methyltransferase [Roseomonas sp. CCTCC AB2023176]|uniref:class I SAM-dependent methyltransferase n=1 Tax=Roseomonas sp. CCTCC AB2023176 TaxID=3342640 RepID=UPI0035DEA789
MSGPLTEALAGRIPPAVAIMRMLLAGARAEAVQAELGRLDAAPNDPVLYDLRRIASDRRGLETLERLVAAGADHAPAGSPEAGLTGVRDMFDRLVRVSPTASVAAYSLGDEARLAEATAEVVAWLAAQGLLSGKPAVLDLGCGIGRFCRALAAHGSRVVGTEVSGGMAAEARRRCAGLPGVGIVRVVGDGLDALRDASFDLVLAADVFPYLVGAGGDLAARHLSGASRVTRPGGAVVILNYSYRGREADARDLPVLAHEAGLRLIHADPAPFRTWDAAAYVLCQAARG